ncbi:MAG: hypothetical protein AB7S77_00295 [Desulfatirhabdiaceae bacterium]
MVGFNRHGLLEARNRCFWLTAKLFRRADIADWTFLGLFGVIIGWSVLSVFTTDLIGVSIERNHTTSGELVKGVILRQMVPVQLIHKAESVCYEVQFATYHRINNSQLKVTLSQKDYHQSVVLNTAFLQDNRSHPFCFSADGLNSGEAVLEIYGINGVPGKSAAVWMTSDMPNGSALKNGRIMEKGLVFRAYVRNHIYHISVYLLILIVVSVISAAIIFIKNAVFKIPEGIEFIIFLFFVLCASYTAAPVFTGMTSTSLWNDELYSILKFSGAGPVNTLTDYHVPNNHIFFNFLNSLIPFSDRYHPFSARLLSFISMSVSVILPVGFMIRRKMFFEACFLFFILIANKSLIDLCLQARGYGFLLLAASVCCVLTWMYLETVRPRYAVGMAVTVWLATWTVPTFIVFGAPLLIILWIHTRENIWFYAGMLCAIAVLLVYFPVYPDLVNNHKTYAVQWGSQFADWNAVSETIGTYLLLGLNNKGNWFSFAFVLILAAMLIHQKFVTPHERSIYIIAIASALCFLLAMIMKTPLPRTMSFVAFPLGFIFVLMLGSLFSRLTQNYGRTIMIVALAIGVFLITAFQNTARNFTPIEAWMETADAVNNRFPVSTRIYAPFRNQFLAIFLSPERQFSENFDLTLFTKGEMIVVDSSFVKEQAFKIDRLPKKYAVITIPQRRGGSQRIYYCKENTDTPG